MDISNLQSAEVEANVLGACLVNPDHLDEVDLSPDDFYSEKNQQIFRAMKVLASSETTPDYITLSEYFQRKDKPEMEPYITGLIAEAAIGFSISDYCRIIRDYGNRRRILNSAYRLQQMAYNTDKPLGEPLAEIIDDLATGSQPKHGATHWEPALSEYYDWLEERSQNPGELWGIPTGFLDFDKATGGLHPGELVYIAGEPGVGKSIMSIQMGVQMAKAGYPGAIYSLEMGMKQVIGRIIAGQTKVQSRAMKSGKMSSEEWDNVIKTIEAGQKWPLYISDDAMLTTASIRADLAKLKSRHGITWSVVDYDMLLNDGDSTMNEIAFTTMVSKRLKAIAKDLEIALVTVSSVTKDAIGDEGAPTMKGMRGSAQKLHNADIAGFLTRHAPTSGWGKGQENLRTFTFVKGREMETLPSFNLVKFENYPAFGDCTR